MKRKIYVLTAAALLTFGTNWAQELSVTDVDAIETAVLHVFEKSIEAGEKLSVNDIYETTNDALKAGFIDNGTYFNSFDELMARFTSGIQGLTYQKINVDKKKVTALSSTSALLTAHGNYAAKLDDGRVLTGKFAWTFVYSKTNGAWKVIHSHMSNPQS